MSEEPEGRPAADDAGRPRTKSYMEVEDELDPLGCVAVTARTTGCLLLLTIGKAAGIAVVIVVGILWYSC